MTITELVPLFCKQEYLEILERGEFTDFDQGKTEDETSMGELTPEEKACWTCLAYFSNTRDARDKAAGEGKLYYLHKESMHLSQNQLTEACMALNTIFWWSLRDRLGLKEGEPVGLRSGFQAVTYPAKDFATHFQPTAPTEIVRFIDRKTGWLHNLLSELNQMSRSKPEG